MVYDVAQLAQFFLGDLIVFPYFMQTRFYPYFFKIDTFKFDQF
jgi:hypothetical protein